MPDTAAPPVPSDISSDIDSTLAGLDSTTYTAPSSVAPPEETQVQQAEAPTADGVTVPEAEEQTQDEPFDDDIGEPKEIDFQGKKEWHFPKEKGQALVASHKMVRELQEAIPDLTVEAAKEHFAAAVDQAKMVDAVAAGDPDQVFAKHWMDIAAESPQGVAGLGSRMVQQFYARDPQGFENAVATPIITTKLNNLQDAAIDQYNQADAALKRNPDSIPAQNAKKAARANLYAAQQAAYSLIGTYKQPNGQGAAGQNAFAQQQQAQLNQQRQEFETRQRQSQQVALQAKANDFDQTLNAGLQAKVQEVFDKVKDQLPANAPKITDAIKRSVVQEVKDQIESNGDWKAHFELQKNAALRQGDERSLAQVREQYLSRVANIARRQAAPLIAQLSKDQVTAQNAKLGRLQASQRTEINGSARAVPQSIARDPAKANSRASVFAELDELLR